MSAQFKKNPPDAMVTRVARGGSESKANPLAAHPVLSTFKFGFCHAHQPGAVFRMFFSCFSIFGSEILEKSLDLLDRARGGAWARGSCGAKVAIRVGPNQAFIYTFWRFYLPFFEV